MLKIAWAPAYIHPLPEGHRFPMIKYELIPQQLLYEGTISEENLFEPVPVTSDIVLLTHTREYYHKLISGTLTLSEIRKTGFPYSPSLVERELLICGGTVAGAEIALESGIAMNVAGGTHHAYSDRGEGFCLLNDIAIAANYLLEKKLRKKILVADLDVHQGNGTAEIFMEKPRAFTFSMHGRNNYPYHKERSDLDIELQDGTGDVDYLRTLEQHFYRVLEKQEPDFVFYQSGVDILASDKLGKLSVSRQGCKERDHLVLKACKEAGIPVMVTMGGGYSERIADIVEAHCNTFRLAQKIFF